MGMHLGFSFGFLVGDRMKRTDVLETEFSWAADGPRRDDYYICVSAVGEQGSCRGEFCELKGLAKLDQLPGIVGGGTGQCRAVRHALVWE